MEVRNRARACARAGAIYWPRGPLHNYLRCHRRRFATKRFLVGASAWDRRAILIIPECSIPEGARCDSDTSSQGLPLESGRSESSGADEQRRALARAGLSFRRSYSARQPMLFGRPHAARNLQEEREWPISVASGLRSRCRRHTRGQLGIFDLRLLASEALKKSSDLVDLLRRQLGSKLTDAHDRDGLT